MRVVWELPLLQPKFNHNNAVLPDLPNDSPVLGVEMSHWNQGNPFYHYEEGKAKKARREAKRHTTTHHRKPRSLGGTDEPRNISELIESHHQSWHTLFQNWSPEQIAFAINHYYLDPDFEFKVIKKP